MAAWKGISDFCIDIERVAGTRHAGKRLSNPKGGLENIHEVDLDVD